MAESKFRNKIKKNKKGVLKEVAKKTLSAVASQKGKYISSVGRRKTATARVRLYPSKQHSIIVNSKPLEDFFSLDQLIKKVRESLDSTSEKFTISILTKGGGINSQAEAARLAISRSLVKHDRELRSDLKSKGFLKRDPRSVERKKPGLKKSRKAPTWVKR